jgi:hypothetical protein
MSSRICILEEVKFFAPIKYFALLLFWRIVDRPTIQCIGRAVHGMAALETKDRKIDGGSCGIKIMMPNTQLITHA